MNILLLKYWNINVRTVLAVLGMGVCAVAFGLLAVTANPVLISLGIGLIGGTMLLGMPRATVWMIFTLGLLSGAFISFPGFSRLPWIVSLLGMLLLLPALMKLFSARSHRLPAFIWIALVFLIYSLVVTVLRGDSLGEFLAGFKRYFQMYGLMLALTLLAFTPAHFAAWRRLLVGIALLQFPFALYELLVLVPQRGGLTLSSAASDVVAGTFGANLKGGSPSSVMVIYLFTAISFFVARWRAGLMETTRFVLLVLLCLLPIGMGETKIALFMLLLVGMVLLRADLHSSPVRYLSKVLVLVLLACALGYWYVTVIMGNSVSEVITSTIRYNYGDQGYSQAQILNRFTSLTFWGSRQGLDDPVGMLLGNGLGSSYTSQNALAGHIGIQYLHYGINLTAASTLLWDTGIFGLLLFTGIFCSAWRAANQLRRQSADAAIQADALAIQAALSLFLLSILYSDAIVNLLAMEIIYAAVLGYLAYLIRQHNSGSSPAMGNTSVTQAVNKSGLDRG